jgi:hypothetical protein
MKKKFFITLLAIFVCLPCTLLFTACKKDNKGNTDPKPVALTASAITLEYNSTFYTGAVKEPRVTVTVNNKEVVASEYSVTYSNNIDAGSAEVLVTARTGSKIISGSAKTNFTISPTRKYVDNFTDFKTYLNNSNYNQLTLMANIEIPEGENIVIPANS